MRLGRELRSHLQYKIILPFLALTLLVALAGSAVSLYVIASTTQERLNNQLAQVARSAGDVVATQESFNLQYLFDMAFAQPNPQANAPAVADALANDNPSGLEAALEPFFRAAAQRQGVRLDRLIVFDDTGSSLVDWERVTRDGQPTVIRHDPRSLAKLWFVPRILGGQADEFGDKYAGLLDLGDSDAGYLYSAAPVVQDGKIVGGLIVASRIDSLLATLRDSSLAASVSLYSADTGAAFASTQVPKDGLKMLDIRRDLLASARDPQLAQDQSIIDTVDVNGRNYQFAYAPLMVRGSVIGLISVALASDYVTTSLTGVQRPLIALTIGLMLAIIGLGLYVARQITRPLHELVSTAQAVIGGDLERRSHVEVEDEVGILATAFNDMTAHLLDLYDAVQSESGQRAAIVESIADGIIVCDQDGEVLVINRMTRKLLRLSDGENGPQRFEDVPLVPLEELAITFGVLRTPNLYTLNDKVLRVVSAPVVDEHGVQIGVVYVLQDLTDQVAIDRAKTNFIGTISHELRTPLTVLGGSSELLLRELAGPLTPEQHTLIESMRRHTLTMTSLLQNVITIAGLEAGTLTVVLEPISLSGMLDDLLWSVRPAIRAKGLDVKLDIPDDLPSLLADVQQLRNVLAQLLDNARRYTESGMITIRAYSEANRVRVDISDTGRGISPELAEHLFTRFTRGAEGINSSERGIGLGLAIARLLIEQQGGTIWLERTSAQGSTFSFTVPCVSAESQYKDSVLATAA